jgi:hypothetical protein
VKDVLNVVQPNPPSGIPLTLFGGQEFHYVVLGAAMALMDDSMAC